MSETVRTFIAIPLTCSQSLKNFFVKLGDLKLSSVKLVERHQLHLTLQFLGDIPWNRVVEVSRIVEAVADQHVAYSAEMKGLGAFPNTARPRVIWTGLQPAHQLFSMTQQLNQSLIEQGFSIEDRAFKPHVTIARIKGKQDIRLLNLIESSSHLEFGLQHLNSIILYQSELTPTGPQYTAMSEHLLR